MKKSIKLLMNPVHCIYYKTPSIFIVYIDSNITVYVVIQSHGYSGHLAIAGKHGSCLNLGCTYFFYDA